MGALPLLFIVRVLRARRAVCLLPIPSSARVIPSTISFSRAAWSILDCARRTKYMLPPSSLVISQGWRLIDLPLRAAFSPAHPLARRDVPVARARAFQLAKPRFREWPRLPFTARIERALSECARSASKKGTWPLSIPSTISFSRVAWSILDCARRTSTFLSCAFREQEDDQATLFPPHLRHLHKVMRKGLHPA